MFGGRSYRGGAADRAVRVALPLHLLGGAAVREGRTRTSVIDFGLIRVRPADTQPLSLRRKPTAVGKERAPVAPTGGARFGYSLPVPRADRVTARYLLLGPVVVQLNRRQVVIEGPRRRAVLAYLLLSANRVVSVDELIAAVWGETQPRTARTQIQSNVSAIRHRLRGEHLPSIDTRGSGYVVVMDSAELDVDLFGQSAAQANALKPHQAASLLRDALGLWRGAALADATAAFVTGARKRLHEQRLTAYEQLAHAELALGRHAELAVELTALVADNPLREHLTESLMLALYRSGRAAEALRVSRNLRALLVENEGLDPNRAHAELEAAIVRSDPALDWKPPPVTPAGSFVRASSGFVPAQLPADTTHFTGRGDELAQLDGWAADRSTACSPFVISGGPGVGKSSLAVHWGWRVAPRFPDGQLYFNLRGRAPEPPALPIEVLSMFLRALGVAPERVPLDIEDAADRYRALLRERTMLIVLDDAASAEQIRPLLPGGSSRVMVTTRERLVDVPQGVRRLALRVLAPDEAVRLLTKVVGPGHAMAEPEAAELARLCAYLPLALRVAAANLQSHRHRGLADLITDLQGVSWPDALQIEGDSATQVYAAFETSYVALEPEAQHLFRRVGLMPGSDFTLDDAAAVAGRDIEETHRLLRRLTDAHLVDQLARDRYGQHDLVRRYAVERVEQADSPADREHAVRRLLSRYLFSADHAADLIYPEYLRARRPHPQPTDSTGGFADKVGAIAWLDAERSNLVAAIHRGAAEEMHDLCWMLTDALRGFFAIRRHLSDWLGVAEAALAAADAAGDPLGTVSARLGLAQVLWMSGRRNESVNHLKDAHAAATTIGWRDAEAHCLSNLGAVYAKLGRLGEAVEYLVQARDVRPRTDEPTVAIAVDQTNLGHVCYERGQFKQAASHARCAVDLHRDVESPGVKAHARANLGEALLALGDEAAAAEHLTAAAGVFRDLGEQGGEASALMRLARVRLWAGDRRAAGEQASAAVAAARESGAGHVEAAALNLLGLIDHEPDRHDQALRVAHAAEAPYVEAQVLLGYAETLTARGRFGEAAAYARQALIHAQQREFRALEGHALTALAEVRAAQGSVAQSYGLAKLALSIHRETGHTRLLERTLRITDIAS
jgi:DNA-binding SARP family transcriptional activator